MRVAADREKCASSSLCVYAVPEVFDQDEEEGLVVVVDAQPAPALHGAVRHAARSCPTRSIRVAEETE